MTILIHQGECGMAEEQVVGDMAIMQHRLERKRKEVGQDYEACKCRFLTYPAEAAKAVKSR